MHLHQTLPIALLSLLLFACGGSLEDEADTATDTATDTITDATDTVELTARLLDCPSSWDQDIALCTDTTEISAIKPGVLAVTLTQSSAALASQIITASVSKGALQPDSALTDSNGIAFFTLVSSSDEGAGRITVTTDAAEQETTSTLNFEIGASNVEIAIDNDTAGVPLAQNATALISVNLSTDEGPYPSPVDVTFSSICAAAGTAKLDKSVSAINGVAQATYQPVGCSGTDLITANAEVNNLSASTSIEVSSSPAQSIRYMGASPRWVALKGTGGLDRQETSTISFKLVDKNGLPSNQQDVEFILDIGPSGTIIEPLTAKTNSEGEVSTVVSSGAVSGVVRVKARLPGSEPLVTSVSDELTVSTGLPDQNSFSLSLENYAPEAWDYDGVTVKSTVRLADHFNNAVPDGTAVYFTTEGGSIKDESTGMLGSCLTAASECSLIWESQAPRPQGNRLSDWDSVADSLLHSCAESTVAPFAPCINSGGMGQPFGGRVTITAFAVGEENFVDKNGNGWFDTGDTFKLVADLLGDSYDLPEVFYDHDENGRYDTSTIGGAEENFHDFNPVDGAYSPANRLFNGVLCSEADDDAGLCERTLINVRDSKALIMASGNQYFRVQNADGDDVNSVDLKTVSGSGVVTLQVYVADINNNRPPTGSTIEISTTNGVYDGEAPAPLANSSAYGPIRFPVTLTREAEPNKKSDGTLTIKLASPSGIISTYSLTVSDDG